MLGDQADRMQIGRFSGSADGTVGDTPGKGETFSGSSVSDGGILARPPPGMPESGEFGNKGKMRRFSCPIQPPFTFLTPEKKIRANRRYWAGDLFSNRLG
jgi:hypothetical protein